MFGSIAASKKYDRILIVVINDTWSVSLHLIFFYLKLFLNQTNIYKMELMILTFDSSRQTSNSIRYSKDRRCRISTLIK